MYKYLYKRIIISIIILTSLLGIYLLKDTFINPMLIYANEDSTNNEKVIDLPNDYLLIEPIKKINEPEYRNYVDTNIPYSIQSYRGWSVIVVNNIYFLDNGTYHLTFKYKNQYNNITIDSVFLLANCELLDSGGTCSIGKELVKHGNKNSETGISLSISDVNLNDNYIYHFIIYCQQDIEINQLDDVILTNNEIDLSKEYEYYNEEYLKIKSNLNIVPDGEYGFGRFEYTYNNTTYNNFYYFDNQYNSQYQINNYCKGTYNENSKQYEYLNCPDVKIKSIDIPLRVYNTGLTIESDKQILDTDYTILANTAGFYLSDNKAYLNYIIINNKMPTFINSYIPRYYIQNFTIGYNQTNGTTLNSINYYTGVLNNTINNHSNINYNNGSENYETYKTCNEWYDIPCQAGNAVTYIIYNVPILSPIFELVNSMKTGVISFINLIKEFEGFGIIFSITIVGMIYCLVKKLYGNKDD